MGCTLDTSKKKNRFSFSTIEAGEYDSITFGIERASVVGTAGANNKEQGDA